MSRLNDFVNRWFPLHPNVIRIKDVALYEIEERDEFPVTAWKWECKLCGAIIDELSLFGIEKLKEGVDLDDIMKWMRDDKENT
jgi:hypothetical protein